MNHSKIGPADPLGLLNEARDIAERWTYPDRVHINVIDDDNWLLHLSTGGWSENEALIDDCSVMFHAVCWVASRRGGHHVYGRGELADQAWKQCGIPWPACAAGSERGPSSDE